MYAKLKAMEEAGRCSICGKGHSRADCPEKGKRMKCTNCKRPNHLAQACSQPVKNASASARAVTAADPDLQEAATAWGPATCNMIQSLPLPAPSHEAATSDAAVQPQEAEDEWRGCDADDWNKLEAHARTAAPPQERVRYEDDEGEPNQPTPTCTL